MKRFLILWLSQAFALFGSSIMSFVLVWYLASESESAVEVSIAILFSVVPRIIVGPFIGPLIDRFNRKKILVFENLFNMLLTAGLIALFFSGLLQVWHIYAAMLLRSITESVHFPAMQASVSMIVSDKHLSRAGGLNQSLRGLTDVISPVAAGFLLNVTRVQNVLAIDAATALAALVLLLLIYIPQPARAFESARSSVFSDLLEGCRLLLSWRGLRILVGFSVIFNLFYTPSMNLLPVFVTTDFGGNVMILGFLSASDGLGFMLGGLLLAAWIGFRKRIYTMLTGFFIVGATIIMLGFATEKTIFLGICGLLLSGFGLAVVDVAEGAILQSVVPKQIQGRVFSLYMSLVVVASVPGLLIVGQIADHTGMRPFYIITCIVTLLIVLIALVTPSVRGIEQTSLTESGEK